MGVMVAMQTGHQAFVDELTCLAASTADQRIRSIAERTARPLRVAVRGRRGVGRNTLVRALDGAGSAAGLSATSGGDPADVVVYALAEVVKPEDRAGIAVLEPTERPVLAVLTMADKTDVVGFAGVGPMAGALQRCELLSTLAGLPVEPMSALLAVAALDDLDERSWCALRALAAHPAAGAALDGSHAGFLSADLGVPTGQRLRLLESLDLFGVAIAIEALRRGAARTQVRALLRKISGIDAVVAKAVAAGAGVRYGRVLEAVAALEVLAVADEQVSEFLAGEAAVLARMSAALDAASTWGLDPFGAAVPPDDPGAQLQRALRWRRHRSQRGPAAESPDSDLRRWCGADIVRGSLRLWSRAAGSLACAGPPEGGRPR
ncbi:hypothetical protein [Mycobacterium marinum]|uniref:hypothetical protein n=1 Tax=Mycobacterium marinum TaxID=1781 RepID=UPI002359E32E|nr:hypothetical protein [Mycobacterium marinum]MDC8982875.1 hypothetical protein [Mycobacterium marinum]MDC8999764.1 hypothetical protein [Mycobacterium marinum]MDC9010155.1 hypothetical protein [Mycobacterium marinum]MDC9016009.1 hypothetical protein [Mycobacterium marinum]